MNVKVCTSCSTVNDTKSQFCRICGKEFDKSTITETDTEQNIQPPISPIPPVHQPPQQPYYYQNQYAPPPPAYNNGWYTPPYVDPKAPIIEDITTEELSAFVGAKANKFIPKFTKMFQNNSKVSFNWVVFLLSFLLSPIIGSFWFFHRKIYKMGILLLAIGVALTIISIVSVIPLYNSLPKFFDQIASNAEKYQGDSENPQLEKDMMTSMLDFYKSFVPLMIISSVVSLLSLASAVVFSMFADYWYKELALRKIREVKSTKGSDLQAIANKGGTEAFIWVIILICYFIISTVFTVLFCISYFTMIGDFINKMPTYSDGSGAFFSIFKK